jgi:hypothetical protein
MKIKLSELRKMVRQGLQKIREDYEVSADGSIDMENPVVLWNDTFDMHDQETMTKVANRRINLNEPGPGDDDEVDRAIKTLMGSDSKITSEAKKKKPEPRKGKKDSYGCESPFAIDKYAKKKSKLKDGKPSMREAMGMGMGTPSGAGSTDANIKGYLSMFFLEPD